jgi:thiamine kinase-like enzyme
MNRPADASGQTVSTAELRAALDAVLSQHFGGRRVAGLTRRTSEYSSSFAIDELDVRLEDGTVLDLVFKNVGWHALLEDARRAKPPFLHDPLREIETYRTVLAAGRLGTARFYGAVVDPERERYWLFLERVPGLRLSHVGEFATWLQVARYLADLHNSLARAADALGRDRPSCWLSYDRDYYRQWMDRALTSVRGSEAPGGEVRPGIERLACAYDKVIDRLLALPTTLIHGEFYSANVVVHETGAGPRICPIDWEMTAVAPRMMDLAALTGGMWTEEEKRALALAYRDALEPGEDSSQDLEPFFGALDLCQLHLAVQWLGWSLEWSAPPQQAWNWSREALRLAEKVAL